MAEPEQAQESYRDSILRMQPMETEGLDSNLAGMLKKYYDRTFGGAEKWDRIQSVRFDGLLHLPQGMVRFVAFKKKPDYCKVVIFLGGESRLVMAFDGEDTWQLNTSEAGAVPADMPEKEARNFIRDATVGGHLLYPQIEGKEIEHIGMTEVDGLPCYQIEVKLPDGERILSAVNIGNFSEMRQTTRNALSGLEETISFSDFRQIDEVRFPFASVMKSEGEVVHRVEMLKIQTNIGIMPWMFQRPSGAYTPGEEPELSTFDLLKEPEVKVTPKEGFGLDGGRQTVFPDLDASETKSILDDIAKPIF